MPDITGLPKIGLSRLIETVPASFSSSYLTLVSLIQGVALGLLALKFPDIFSNLSNFTFVAFVAFFYAVLTLVVLVIVWHEYVLSAQEFWWEIKWWDSLIPFTLGLGEFLMIEYLGKGPDYDAWFFSTAFTAFCGFWAYINYGWWIKKTDFEKPEAFDLFKKEVNNGRWFLGAWCLFNLGAGFLIYFWAGTLIALILGGLSAFITVLMVRRRVAWQQRAWKIYGWQK
jgi:hypothetical protein